MARLDFVLSNTLKKSIRKWSQKLSLTMGAFVRQAVIEKIKKLNGGKL